MPTSASALTPKPQSLSLRTIGRPELSVVIPVYNEEDSLATLLGELAAVLQAAGRTYEVVVVDDGSTDGSFSTLKDLKGLYPELHIIAFAANAGQTAAVAAGSRAAKGRVIVTLDADLQNDPADIPILLEALDSERASAVVGYRLERRDSVWKRVQSRVANAVRNGLTGDSVRDTGCSLKAFRADVLRSVPLYDGMHRFLPTLIRLQGGKVVECPVRHRARRFGRTKYGLRNRAVRALVDALGVRWLARRRLRYQVREEL
ncbi:MAG TPA: glycosyltransferase family 2 protein [Gemmatimonadales bacterium]|nr:glycosyltransferase family 2 protein [Gemmatimonadales bacterium]